MDKCFNLITSASDACPYDNRRYAVSVTFNEKFSMSLPTSKAIEIHSGITLKGELSMLKDVVLTGKFDGDLQTYGCLTVTSGGSVTGSIDAGALILEPGNLVEAKVLIRAQQLRRARQRRVHTPPRSEVPL